MILKLLAGVVLEIIWLLEVQMEQFNLENLILSINQNLTQLQAGKMKASAMSHALRQVESM
jgi:hypothetical protein